MKKDELEEFGDDAYSWMKGLVCKFVMLGFIALFLFFCTPVVLYFGA